MSSPIYFLSASAVFLRSDSISAALPPSAPSSIVRGHNFRTAAAEATIYEIGADNAADNLTRRNGEEDEVGPLLVWPRDSPFMGTGLEDQMKVGVQ